MSEQIIILCPRVKGPENSCAVSGATIQRCPKCGNDIWVAPSSIDKIAEDPANTVLCCLDCVDWDQVDEIQEITEAQAREILDAFGWKK